MQLSLTEARELKGISQQELASSMHLSLATIQRYERDPYSMRIAQAQWAAELLGIEFDGINFKIKGGNHE